MDFRPRFRRSIAIVFVTIFLISAGSTPAHAGSIGDYAAPFQSLISVFENVFAEIIALVDPHKAVTVAITPAASSTWHASDVTASAAAFNSVAALQAPTASASSTVAYVDPTPNASVSSSPGAAPKAAALTAVPLATAPQAQLPSYVTQTDLTTQLQQLTNKLTSLVYQNISAPNSVIATGGITNEIAGTSRINQLSGVAITGGTITNAIVNGVSGLTAADIPALAYLSTSGGSLSGALGIGTTSPSDLFALNGAAYLADIAVPLVSTNRLYANSGSLYWAGNLLGGATTGNWSSDGTNVWRAGGNVGIGTTSPFTNLSVVGNGYCSGSLTGDVSGAAVTSTDSTASRTLAARAADVVNVRDFGAKCDGVTDDSAAWNSAIAAIAAQSVPFEGARAARLVGCQTGNSLVASSINFTMFTSFGNPGAFALTVDLNGTCIIGQTNGTPVIDALGARFIDFEHLCVIGSAARTPSIGVQIGRTSSRSADDFYFNYPVVTGQFTLTAFYNFASETDTFVKPFFSNSYTTGSPYALIQDGHNHFNASSAFVTETNPVDTQYSFNENLFNGGTFAVGSAGYPIWIGNAARHRFIAGYAATGGQYGAILYTESTGGISQLLMDVHFETPSLTDIFLISGSNSSPTFSGLTYTDNSPQASNSIFKLDTGVTSATLADSNIHVANFFGGNSVKVFDSPSSWTVGGSVYVPNAGNWVAPASFSGNLCVGSTCSQYKNPGGSLTNTAAGDLTMTGNVTGIQNTAFGTNALQRLTAGNFNTAVGGGALSNQAAGSNGTAFGFGALGSLNASGDDAFGVNAGQFISGGTGNVAFGASALQGVTGNRTTGTDNSAFGITALGLCQGSCSRNTAAGKAAGGGITTGSNSIFLGWNVGSTTASGSNNIALGYDIALPSTNGSNQLDIGNLIFGTGINGEGTNISTGNIGIGTSSPGSTLSVAGSGYFSGSLNINGTSGNLAFDGQPILYASSTRSSISIGFSAGAATTTTGSSNVAIGWQALAITTSGGSNVAVGYQALLRDTTGGANTVVGAGAGANISTGVWNTYLGTGAGQNDSGGQNTGVGVGVLGGNGSGSQNTALGWQAGNSITSGGDNIFVGLNAASSTASGSNNIALGYDIALPSTNGSNQLDIGNLIFGTGINGEGTNISTGNIGIGTSSPGSTLSVAGSGYFSGSLNINGTSGNLAFDGQPILYASSTRSSISIGFSAGAATTTVATNNVAIGISALASVNLSAFGSNNVAVGNGALQNTQNQLNVGVGINAGKGIGNSLWSTAIGANAMSSHDGKQNTAVGADSLAGNGSGLGNSAFGYGALNADTSGASNIAVGLNAGILLTSGSNSIFVGSNTGSTTTTGSNNIALGYDVALPSVNGSNQLDIGNLIFGTGINGEGNKVSTGNVGIGTSSPFSRLEIWGTDAASSTLAFNVVNNASTTVFAVFDGGNAQLSGTLTQSSDARLKTNIQSLDASTSLAAINSLTPVAYDWLDPNKGGTRQYGFIAQQVEPVFPNLVSTTSATALTPDGTLGLNYLGLIAPIVEAVQSLSAEVQTLTSTVRSFADSFTTKILTANTGNFQKLCVQKSDGTSVCVNGDQLAGILSGTPSVQISAPTAPTISGTTTPPSINIRGSNPATINVGDVYTDLGAIVHDNQGHDLSYRTFINSVLSGNILIDTSQMATDTIDYVATDTWGNTSTSTRTVIIEAATSSVQ